MTETLPSDSVALPEDWNINFSDLKLGPELGRGSFGVVYRSRLMGVDVAVKQIKSLYGQVQEFEHEVAMLRSLRHPNIVLFMGVSRSADDLYLVQEFVSGGSLSRILLNKDSDLPWKTRIKMALDIASALLFLHKKKCLHRDLKCENVLIEASEEGAEGYGRCKLADFGLSTLFVKDGKPMDEVGTPWWRAPELSSHYYDTSADIFSFGIVLYEIILRKNGEDIRVEMTFEKQKLVFGVDPKQLRKSDCCFSTVLQQCPQLLLSLAEDCCQEDPAKRPSTEEVVERLHQLYQLSVKLQTFSTAIFRNLESSTTDLRRSLTVVPSSDSPDRSPTQMSTMTRQALKIWTNHAIVTLTPGEDVAQHLVPFSAIVNSLAEKLYQSTARALDLRGREFLASVIEVSIDDLIDISQFGRFWSWFYTTGRVIHHPGVRPLFRDGFIDGFISATACTKLLVDDQREDNFIIRFSSSKPGCLVITCLHATQLRHVLVTVDFFEVATTGCFIIGNQRCTTLREVFTKNNLHFLTSVFPDQLMTGPKFAKAFQEIDDYIRRELKREALGNRMSTDVYDDVLHSDVMEANLFRQLKAELANSNNLMNLHAHVPPGSSPPGSAGYVATPRGTGIIGDFAPPTPDKK